MPCSGLNLSYRGYAELFAVAGESVQLLLRDGVGDGQGQVPGGRVVVGGGDGEVGSAHLASRHAQPVERLRGCNFVNQMQVDV